MKALIAAVPILAALAAPLLYAPMTADACAGLIGSNGAVNLARTSTLAGYHDGVEHYITAFQFQGGGGQFGSLIPLPDVPTKVEKGGAWTLQRLEIETRPPAPFPASGGVGGTGTTSGGATVLQEVRIDALDLTVLEGGGADVARWAQEHGFRLSPDAPEVLDFYARRSPIFLAAVFDAQAAATQGQQLGDGTPVHLTIPTDNPWVPLRILGLGNEAEDFIEADVYLLTNNKPTYLPVDRRGMDLVHDALATPSLLNDLRSDAGMEWVPQAAWLTKFEINSSTSNLSYDLAVDANGSNPSFEDTGLGIPLSLPQTGGSDGASEPFGWPIAASALLLALLPVSVWALAWKRGGTGTNSRPTPSRK
jgi:Uncharacterized protein conserved in bacteria (DUF2330)